MSSPVPQARTLITDDGVPIDVVHLPGDEDLAIVVAHGFTLSWQRPSVWRVISRMRRFGGVLSFDFRGHGRSGGASTLGDREIKDLAVVVAYARELGYLLGKAPEIEAWESAHPGRIDTLAGAGT